MKKRRFSRLGQQTEHLFSLPVGSLTDMPHVELNGDRQLYIENCRRLDIYEEDEIRLDTACGQMQIVGHGLHLTEMTPDSLAVGGRILAVCFLE